MMKIQFALTALALVAAACSSPAPEATPETAPPQAATSAAVPAEIAAAASAAAPGISITGGDFNANRTQFEVTGTMPNGDEVELDVAQVNGTWTVEEIQRDVPWASVPEPVRAAAATAPNKFEPVRVIESKNPDDGSVVYELFAAPAQGTPAGGPALEVRWLNEKAELLP
jgi:ABC-type glycerol-3-phosphate transport system substrate-binding protein